MTNSEALVEARRRWGDTARVRHQSDPNRAGPRPYAVGVLKGAANVQEGELFVIHGQGASWEEAFQEAGQERGGPFPAPRPPNAS
jgi:hypothetical protein